MFDFFRNKHKSVGTVIKSIDELEAVRIVRLTGAVDATTLHEIEQLRERLANHESFEFKHVLLDFADVTHTDSSTVAEIIELISNIKKTHHKLGVMSVDGNFRSVFEIFRVDKLIHLYNTEAEAIRDLESGMDEPDHRR